MGNQIQIGGNNSQSIQIGDKQSNGVQKVTMNGNVIIHRNGEFTINGVNVKTGVKVKPSIFDIRNAIFGGVCFFIGAMVMLAFKGGFSG